MKYNKIILSTVLLVLFGAMFVQAQEINPEKNNYLVLSKNIQQLKPILLTAGELAKEDGADFGEYHVVICGKTVKDIAGNEGFATLLKTAKEKNVKVHACGLSLSKFKIDPETLPSDLDLIPNGILYGFQMSKKGFITLSI